jgi:excisionase family DNA binding protein
MKIGRLIQLRRKEKGWTQKNLAEKLRIDRSLLSRIEIGDRAPNPKLWNEISKLLDLDKDLLLQFLSEPQQNKRGTLTLKEAAEFLRLSAGTLRRLARARKIPVIKLGRKWLFRQASLERWLAEREIQERR